MKSQNRDGKHQYEVVTHNKALD